MKNIIIVLISFLTLSGCSPSVNQWAKQRKIEIQTAYDNKEITKAEYLSLMNQVDTSVNNHYSSLQAANLSRPIPSK